MGVQTMGNTGRRKGRKPGSRRAAPVEALAMLPLKDTTLGWKAADGRVVGRRAVRRLLDEGLAEMRGKPFAWRVEPTPAGRALLEALP